MYDLFIIGKGFFSDVNLVIWKIMWYFRFVLFYVIIKYICSLFFVGGNYRLEFYIVFLFWLVYIF